MQETKLSKKNTEIFSFLIIQIALGELGIPTWFLISNGNEFKIK